MFITDGRNSGGIVIELGLFIGLGWACSPYPLISWIFYSIPIIYIVLKIRNAILSVIEHFKKRKLRKLHQVQNRT
ncbi:hypothetical protein NHG34_05225 [Aerococcaceae bacterium NML190938]|nr:hypothetical protein [Aerococcaceae bacterium NML190938]